MLIAVMLNVENNPFLLNVVLLIVIMLIVIMLIVVMLIVVMLIVIMLTVFMMNVIMLSVVAPHWHHSAVQQNSPTDKTKGDFGDSLMTNLAMFL